MGRGALLALASGALLALSFPAPGLWPLALVGHAPLLLALASASPARAALLGWLSHAALNLILFRFLWTTLRDHGALGPGKALLSLLLFAAIQGARGAGLGLLTALGRRWLPLPSAFVLALLASERVPLLLDWSVSAALHDQLALAQAASIGGAPLVSLLAAAGGVAAATAAARLAGRGGFARGWAWAGAGCVAGAALWGAWRAQSVEREAPLRPLRVGLVHGDIALGDEASPAAGWPALLRAHDELERSGAELIVWPETSAPWALREEALDDELLALTGRPLRVDTLIGALIEGPSGLTNRALLLRAGRARGSYHKRSLLPFGEATPAGLGWLSALAPARPRLAAPAEAPALAIDGQGLGASICYEGILPGRVREVARRSGARLLVNLTNDAWFRGTSEPELHLAATRLRAIELGRFMVRATNGGVSAVISPTGRLWVEVRGGPTRPAQAQVGWREEETFYGRWGEAGAWGAGLLLATLFAGVTTPWRRRQGEAGERARETAK